jgi:hypothetical protein
MSDFFNKLLDKVKSMTETSSKKKEAENIPENDKSKSSSQNNTITFVMYVLMLLVGYKLYYFNLNLEYYFRKIDYDKTKNIFLTGGNLNKLSKETFENMFGIEINDILTNNLKSARKHDSWFSDYIFNLKLDFSYYFLKFMNFINKFKLTRYLILSLTIGGSLFTGLMFLMYIITAFFSLYGLLRVFTHKLSYYAFALATPLLLMHFITGYILIYYLFKLLFLDTKLPTGDDKPKLFGKIEYDKLVILSFVLIWFSSRIPLHSNTVNIVKRVLYGVSSLFIIFFTYKYDFFFVKDRKYIWDFLKRNSGNFVYLALFITCIILFSIYQ